ncbi:MAG TPA: PEP-CTERM sorting domain-containing protein [Terriglobales bacterium]|nr:PEP-CTERM sorting domain-containing protein [Terriglobales bacterium]
MRKTAIALCFVFALLTGLRAHASPLDPTIGIADPSCSSWNPAWGPLLTVTDGNAFTFSPNNGGGFFGFCNQTSAQWTQLDIMLPATGPDFNYTTADITCTGGIYTFCDKTLLENGYIDLFLHDPNNQTSASDPGGVHIGHFLTINLNDDQCDPTNPDTKSCTPLGSWANDVLFTGLGNGGPGSAINAPVQSVPEPAAILLVGSGLAGLWELRRRKNKK